MNVHIDTSRIDVDEQEQGGAAATRDSVAIGRGNGMHQYPVLNCPAVDEEVLDIPTRSRLGRPSRESRQPQSILLSVEGYQPIREILTEHLGGRPYPEGERFGDIEGIAEGPADLAEKHDGYLYGRRRGR